MKKMAFTLFLLCLLAVLAIPAGALDYTVDAPEDHLFGQPTSDETIYEPEAVNVDRSKNAALIPPAFGSPTSYLPGSGEALTPNLLPGALDGGLVNQAGPVEYPTISRPQVSYTEVTDDLYYSGGHLGTLKIPSLGLSVRVYEGTDDAALKKGVGHFESTSIWSGNVALAGHNRGVNTYFGQIHTLKAGDVITLTTKLGTRVYAVTSVSQVRETDRDGLASSARNQITLYTCVRDQPELRWCVQAREVG